MKELFKKYLGLRFANLTILDVFVKNKITRAQCRCDCGNNTITSLSSLKVGHATSCGCKAGRKKYNTTFFTIPSPQRSYIVGLISADGTIDGKQHRLTLALQERDKEILYELNKYLSEDNLVSFKPTKYGQNQYKFRISNIEIIKQLNILGIYPNKSKTYQVPELFKNDPHYWRGIIDGDGHISLRKNRKNFLYLGLCGTKDVCENFKQFCTDITGHTNTLTVEDSPTNKNFCRYKIGGSYAANVCKVLYDSAGNLAVRRKFENFKSITY